jgi:peptidoglycan/LPS O-acetylase OafA/YrhL
LRWLGDISFSLYLVHLPIVLAVARFGLGLWVTLPVAIVVSLIVAKGFHDAIEVPSQRVASRLRAQRTTDGHAPPPTLEPSLDVV